MFIFITNKNIDIEISARDAFMEKPLTGYDHTQKIGKPNNLSV